MDSLEKEEMQLDFTQEELIELIQAKNKEIKKLREELEKSKKNSLHRVINALGIRHIGEKNAKTLENKGIFNVFKGFYFGGEGEI